MKSGLVMTFAAGSLAVAGAAGWLLYRAGENRPPTGAEATLRTESRGVTPTKPPPPSPVAAVRRLRDAAPAAPASAAVAFVVGRTGNGDYGARVLAVRALDPDVIRSDRRALYDWLAANADPGKLPPPTLNALKNEVAGALSRLDPPLSDFTDELAAIYDDTSLDPVWRDYCIQFLGSLCAHTADAATRARIRATLWQATSDTQEATAGTALIALSRNADTEGFSRSEIGRRALEVCRSQVRSAAKATALQVAALMGEQGGLPLAREWARSGPVNLRMSALAALGTLGGPDDRALLAECAAESDTRVRTAAAAALRRLEGRRS